MMKIADSRVREVKLLTLTVTTTLKRKWKKMRRRKWLPNVSLKQASLSHPRQQAANKQHSNKRVSQVVPLQERVT
jgi:hypothetical protein